MSNVQTASKPVLTLTWVVLFIGALVMLVPFYVMLVISLKTPTEYSHTFFLAWPKEPTLDAYRQVLSNPNVSFGHFFQNTVIIAVLSTIGVVMTSALVAYPFARMQFIGKDRLFILLLSTMMLPGIVTMIPTYILFKYLHWIDTFYPLIVPAYFGGGAYNIFLLRQFFMGIPKDLDEAARLDGATHSTIFWRVVMPLSGPALATVSVFSFVGAWKDFMGPLIYFNDPDKQTLELGLKSYQSLAQEKWELIMAASVMVMLPLIIIFLFTQRFFVKGIVMTGLK